MQGAMDAGVAEIEVPPLGSGYPSAAVASQHLQRPL